MALGPPGSATGIDVMTMIEKHEVALICPPAGWERSKVSHTPSCSNKG